MIGPHKKKLIEVALPLQAINKGCEEDKNRKTGHIRNLHKWFAPMPLPSWRAMLFASVIDDPGEYLPPEQADVERRRLLEIVARLADFNAYKDRELLATARREIQSIEGDQPIVVDPFCGGGSTLLEAQRLGLRTQASDLNPIPVLITTALCRIPSLFGNRPPVRPDANGSSLSDWQGPRGLMEDIQYYARQIRSTAWNELQELYPSMGGAIPFAYRWSWTVPSPDPAEQRLYMPLVSNWEMSRHRTNRAFVVPEVTAGKLTFRMCRDGETLPEPTTGRTGGITLNRRNPLTKDYLRDQGKQGQLRCQMFAVAARLGEQLVYKIPDENQLAAAACGVPPSLPDIEMPDNPRWFSPPLYGFKKFTDLFTSRQSRSLEVFGRLVGEMNSLIERDAVAAGLRNDHLNLEDGGNGAKAYADAVTAVLGLCVGKMAQSNNVLVRWFIDPRNGSGKATPAFDRHAVPMVWDFVETNPFGESVGDWCGPVLQTALRAFELCVFDVSPTDVRQLDARDSVRSLPLHSMVATDPPYYANIGYADLSDFFYLWLRLALRGVFPKLFGTLATPKAPELIATPVRHEGDSEKAAAYFRDGFGEVFGSVAKRADPRFPIVIVYAIKQSEESDDQIGSTGWEVFLSGLVEAGIQIVATWPVRTTTVTRMIGLGTNALASAIFVVGRERPESARIASRREFSDCLKSELPSAVGYLQSVNIAPVDLAQAAIGPGMAVYTRYATVLDAAGNTMTVYDALALINEVLDEVLTNQEGDFDSDTRWALSWFDQYGFSTGEFGVAETLSKAKNTSVDGIVEAGIVLSRGGKVRLLKPEELPDGWTRETDARLTTWEMVHQLVRALNRGEGAVAALVIRLGSKAEIARELAYRLYSICERRKRSQEAISYNALVQSWPEIKRLAQSGSTASQTGLFSGEVNGNHES